MHDRREIPTVLKANLEMTRKLQEFPKFYVGLEQSTSTFST